ncbi:uncharacterized protein C19orf47 homolog [Amyelois transitella]|uniref:uncharacterized protein C19orf47 homolog n=1 Tax=Amyelois transitella TaxID=680683 RepID=UPI00298FB14B|nr:uncharacterized protein C19orf47 homolog [Amyelois transitella]
MSGLNKMDSHLTGMWVSFFTAAGIPSDVSATYALTFTENRIQNDMLLDLNKEYLRDMGITRMGDVIAILRHAKQVHENTARDRVLSTAAPKVPVAAVTGRATVAQPSSPASRMLEHYTRQSPSSPSQSNSAPQAKRKLADTGIQSHDSNIKKSRLIRFASPPQLTVKEATSNKTTVFSRLGNSELPKAAPAKASVKPIYERLGSKPAAKPQDSVIPVPKDALKYEGILKSTAVVKKVVTVTTTKNERKIAVGCTMRADETPLSAKEKLALPKSKSVKFSNQVQYKEIESNQSVVNKTKAFAPKTGVVFNKPERRLSMPEPEGVKARLGTKNANNFTITRNVFNRLGDH